MWISLDSLNIYKYWKERALAITNNVNSVGDMNEDLLNDNVHFERYTDPKLS